MANERTQNCTSLTGQGLHLHTSLHITAHLSMPVIPFGIHQVFFPMIVDFPATLLNLKYVSIREETIKTFLHFNIY